MLYIFQNTDQTVLANDNISFDTRGIQTGITATRSQDGETIFLNKPGFYSIDFSATGATSTAAGEIVISMFVNGTRYSGASGSAYSDAVTDTENIAFPALVQVVPSCNCARVPVTFVNEGVETVYSNVVVKVTKIA